MAEEEQPVFYDFLGNSTQQNDIRHRQQSGAIENLVRGSTVTKREENGLGIDVFYETRAAPDSDSGNSSPKLLQTDMDAMDGLWLYKKPRVERMEENKKGHEKAAMDDSSLTMQPPRLLSANLHRPWTTQLDFSKVLTRHRDGNTHPAGIFGPGRVSQKGLFTDNASINSLKESTAAPLLNVPPADEGSRTGLKRSSVGTLLNQAMAGGPGLSIGQSKSSSRRVPSESTYCASQDTQPITRQLTIFYGGQAHVFEDVSSEKAEAILVLAGSTGRAWSSVYSSRPKSSVPLSNTEGLTYDKDAAKGGSKPSSASYLDNTSGYSTEIHNGLSSVHNKGRSQTGDPLTQEQSSQFAKWAADMLADHIGSKKER